jgi:hypothetical protein
VLKKSTEQQQEDAPKTYLNKFLIHALPPKVLDYFVIKMFIPALKVYAKTKKSAN